MIKLAETSDLEALNEFLSSCDEKSTLFHEAMIGTYGLSQSFFKVYLQKSQQIDAVITLLDNSAFLTVKHTSDTNELKSFLSLNPLIQCVSMDEADFDILTLPENFIYSSADILELKNSVSLPKCNDDIVIPPKMDDIYPIMTEHFSIKNHDEFISDMLHRINHGRGISAAIYENGSVISCASVFFKGNTAALIGGVCTNSNHRKKGLASKLVAKLSEMLRQEDLLPLITCKSEVGKKVYLALGFTFAGQRITITKG